MDSQDNKRKWKNRDLISSLEFALTGILTVLKEERNMQKHAVMAVLACILGFVFQVSQIEWLFLLLSIFLVVSFEIMNSAVENVVDLASEYHFSILAKNAKDMAAGAVLIVSIFAAITGMIIFIPKIWLIIFG
ncbi:Diacylglycerol kinase [Streptococcus sp. DD10]|uniref:diacylglycerol kinase family protein n=1 Tax=Streptococcus sp. DD10 TaxID=1777878 RepID=UPI000793BF1A|nr:diacylglycerol kinase [Streptococcus sp. DD10]KXT73484.1 Diacylglycerol kinase [Streptococcus sp. DD10]